MPSLPWRTLVRNRVSGPSTASAATAVATFVVDAGVASVCALTEYSTSPVPASATSTPSCGPTLLSGSVAATRAASPAAVGSPAAVACAGGSAGGNPAA